MQILILIYHITGASQVLSIYMLMRVLVSSYLFLNGFGHFNYFWKRERSNLSTTNAENKFEGMIRFFQVTFASIDHG
jgi:hypothetical protein